MNDTAVAESSPAKRSRRAAATAQYTVDKGELAARLFVKLFTDGGGRTPAYYAERAVEAAEAFLEVFDRHR